MSFSMLKTFEVNLFAYFLPNASRNRKFVDQQYIMSTLADYYFLALSLHTKDPDDENDSQSLIFWGDCYASSLKKFMFSILNSKLDRLLYITEILKTASLAPGHKRFGD